MLGETSSRQLRAAGKMEDVIFGGTRRRGAMGFAQVRLTVSYTHLCGSTMFRKGSKLYCAKEGCGYEMPVPKKD